MSDPSHEIHTVASSRRGFFKGVGVGALGLSMLGGGKLLGGGVGDVDFDGLEELDGLSEAQGPGACPPSLLSTGRTATLQGRARTVDCCQQICGTNLEDNWAGLNVFRTDFRIRDLGCDELGKIPVSGSAMMVWVLRRRYIRMNGPAGCPIGSLDGSFRVRDIDVNGTVFNLFTGRIHGTIGFEPCAPAGAVSCCAHPRVAGMLTGRGVAGTPADGCSTRWMFCGVEDTGTRPCDLTGWVVDISGVVQCPC